MIIIYHSRDLDGYTSGAILKKRFPEAKLIGYDYGQPIPEGLEGEDIIMVDVSFEMNDLLYTASKSKSFVWIDHHISAINKLKEYSDLPPQLKVVLQDGIAACEIAWSWAFPDREMPLVVTLLGMYDTWRNKDKKYWDEVILPFQYGMRTMCRSAETFPVEMFRVIEQFEIQDVLALGGAILNYQKEQDARAAKSSFTFEWNRYRVIAINGGGFNSNAFQSVYDESKHDIMMPFVYNGNFWVVSLYTTKEIDCAAIAKSMGGGGHKKAAGFQVPTVMELPFSFRLIHNPSNG